MRMKSLTKRLLSYSDAIGDDLGKFGGAED